MNNLDAQVQKYVREGWAIESRTETQAVVSKRKRIGWFFNTVLSVLTGGIWLLVVLYKLVNRKTERVVLSA